MDGEEVELEYCEDGHRPGKTQEKTQLASNLNKASSKFMCTYDDLLPPLWCQRAYDYAVSRQGKPWGVYILTKEAKAYESIDAEAIWKAGDVERAFGIIATRKLVLERGIAFVKEDLERIHGTVVWCLMSGLNQPIEYHIDYAELYRYETNVIHPPLYAGTCHISDLQDGDIEGGDFCANMDGLAHYRQFGYKGKLVGGSDSIKMDLNKSPSWQKVRYKYNRGIFHDGDLPHLSTPVTSIKDGKKRVIFGFNCFTKIVGECCERAPEHSNAFNRTIKLYQAMSSGVNQLEAQNKVSKNDSDGTSTSKQSIKNEKKGGISAKDILASPALSKLILLAAKNKKKLDKEIEDALKMDIAGKSQSKDSLDGEIKNDMQEDKMHFGAVALIATIILSVYISSASPSIAGGDSGELVAEGCTMGIAHPPGYPVFTLIVYVVKRILLLIDIYPHVAYSVNILSCALTAGAAYFMGCTVLLALPSDYGDEDHKNKSLKRSPIYFINMSGAIVAMGLFSFSPLIWQYAVTAEVFPLNTFLSSLILYLVLLFSKSGKFQYAIFGAFICGFSLCNQHTIILYEAPLILWMFILLRSLIMKNPMVLIYLGLSFTAGLLPYLYLPLSAILYPESKGGSWGDTSSFEGFLHHFLRRDYGTFQLFSGATGKSAEGFSTRTMAYLNDITYTQGLYIAPILACFGILCWRRHFFSNSVKYTAKKTSKNAKSKSKNLTIEFGDSFILLNEANMTPYVILFTQLFYFAVFHNLANLPLGDKLLFGVHQRFWMQPNVLLFIWCGIGFNEIVRIVYHFCSFLFNNDSASFLSMLKSMCMPKNFDEYSLRKRKLNKLFQNSICGIAIFLALLIVLLQYQKWHSISDQSTAYYFRDYAKAILDPLPKKSIVLINYDMQWTALRYMTQCEGYRNDITLINLSMMTYAWFSTKRNSFPKLKFPGTHLAAPNSVLVLKGDEKGDKAFTLRQFLDSNIKKHAIFLGGKLTHDDMTLSQQYDHVPTGLLTRFVPMNQAPNGTIYNAVTHTNWQKVSKSLSRLPDIEKYSEETWEWTIGRDFKDRVGDTAAYMLSSAIVSAKDDADPIISAVYWLESAIALEIGSGHKPSSPLLKNAGLGHLHLIQNSKLSTEILLPIPNDTFNTLGTINWPTLNDNPEQDWKKWCSDRFMTLWGEFLRRPDAKKDNQYSALKRMFDEVVAKSKPKNDKIKK